MLNKEKNSSGQSASFQIKTTGLYAIFITAICHHQDDLRIEIDGRSFREIPPERYIQKFNIPAAYNGAKLKGKMQTNIFILNLKEDQHTLNFIYRNNAQVVDWKVEEINDPQNMIFNLNLRAQNLNRQPFLNIILVDLPLHSISAEVSLSWYSKFLKRGDGDDVKLIIDNEITSDNKSNWLWQANKNQKSEVVIQKKTVVANLKTGVHYLEFIGDRSPTIKQIVLDVKNDSSIDEVIYPIVYEGDFEVHTTIRRPYDYDKELIGVYISSGNSADINNENIELYFDNRKLKLGVNEEAHMLDNVFDFRAPNLQEANWFFYGIDSTWLKLPPKLDWRNDEKWKIIKK